MKNKNKILLCVAFGITSAYLYKVYKQSRLDKLKKVALCKINDKNYSDAINILKDLFKCSSDEEIRSLIVKSYYLNNDYENVLLYESNDQILLFECNVILKRHKQALFHIFKHFFLLNDLNQKDKIKTVLDVCIKEEIINHRAYQLSKILYREFFETFPLLFTDFVFESKDGDKIKDIKIVEIRWITEKNYRVIERLVKNERYEELKEYTEDRGDNLSVFIKIAYGIIEMKETVYQSSEYELYKVISGSNNEKYEQKIFTYCQMLRNFIYKKIVNYSYEDVSTLFYRMKIGSSDLNKNIEKVIEYGLYPFVYYFLVNVNHYLAKDSMNLFPTDPKILSICFEIFIFTCNYELADKALCNMKKYCKNDSRTYLCLYYEQKLKYDKEDVDLLLKSYSIDPLFYKTSVLLGQHYLEVDNEKAVFYLKNALNCCNEIEDLYKIYETLILHEMKIRVTNSEELKL